MSANQGGDAPLPSADANREPLLNRFGEILDIAPARRAYSLLEEFKKFAFRGNVIDLAVGVIIGTAFGKIVDSLVKNIVMPVIGLVTPGPQGYLGWKWVVRGQTIPYGLFLGELVNFLIVAAALFLFIVKVLGWLVKSAPPPETVTKDQLLLTEIRDLLKASTASGPRP